MLVKELIEKMKKFNPDGNAEIMERFVDGQVQFVYNIVAVSMEEDADGKLLLILHTIENEADENK